MFETIKKWWRQKRLESKLERMRLELREKLVDINDRPGRDRTNPFRDNNYNMEWYGAIGGGSDSWIISDPNYYIWLYLHRRNWLIHRYPWIVDRVLKLIEL